MNTFEEEHVNYVPGEHQKAEPVMGSNKSQHHGGDGMANGNLDKIRDILFGNQMRDYDKRFNRLEERLVKEYTNLREDTKKRLDSLEIYVQKEVESLMQRVKTDRSERDEAEKHLAEEIKDLIKSLEKKITQLDEQTATNERDVRQQILYQSKSIDEQMRQKTEDILATLGRETAELRTDKTDRSTLASLFAEIAVRLNNESNISSHE